MSTANRSNRNKNDEATRTMRSASISVVATKLRASYENLSKALEPKQQRNGDLMAGINQVEHSSENVHVSYKSETISIPNGSKDSHV